MDLMTTALRLFQQVAADEAAATGEQYLQGALPDFPLAHYSTVAIILATALHFVDMLVKILYDNAFS
jgi:hypothetical protein